MSEFVSGEGVRVEVSRNGSLIVGGDVVTARGVRALREFFAQDVPVEPAKPWEDAKDGEVWALTGAAGLEQPWRRVEGQWISFTRAARPYAALAVTAGRRIWPEES